MLTETVFTNEVESLFDSINGNSFVQPTYHTPVAVIIEKENTDKKPNKYLKTDAENMLEKQLDVAKRMLERAVKQKN
jgi:hypothetical protein